MILRLFLSLAIAAVLAIWFLGQPETKDLPGQKQVADIELELREMNNAIVRLQNKSQTAGARTRDEVNKTTRAIQTRIQSAQKRLEEIRTATQTSALRDRLSRA